MKKILVYCESPFVETGAAQVSKHILPVLAEYGHVTAITVNSFHLPPDDCPYTIIPGTADDMLAIAETSKHIREDDYDLLFLTGDCNVLSLFASHVKQRTSKKAVVISYAAIDNDVFSDEFLNCFRVADYPVLFSNYARSVVSRLASDINASVIYHGCEPDVFHPLPEEERQKLRKDSFGIGPETFLVGAIGRNQVRKDLARSMAAFHLFHQKYPDSLLYIHSKQHDQGGILPEQARYQGLAMDGSEIRFVHPQFHEASGIERSKMNLMYNCLDVVISTSMGEGWGLCTTESMAAGVPFIGPRNTVFPEILGHLRGWLVDCGGPSLQYVHYGVSDVPRPMVNVDDMVEKMEEVYANFKYNNGSVDRRTKAARKWTEEHSWKEVEKQWRELFTNALITE